MVGKSARQALKIKCNNAKYLHLKRPNDPSFDVPKECDIINWGLIDAITGKNKTNAAEKDQLNSFLPTEWRDLIPKQEKSNIQLAG